MFDALAPAPQDSILALMAMYREDERDFKIDLGVGVYRDDSGHTPIFESVKKAERFITDNERTKSYVGMRGNVGFDSAMLELVLGNKVSDRMQAIQSPGGCGALRLIADLIARADNNSTVWLSDPTWPNHVPIVKAAGLRTESYPYFDRAKGTVRFEAMCEALKKVPANDIVLLHACCHNPTGANLTRTQWDKVARIANDCGWTPFFDIAYQGFGEGLVEDVYSIRCLADSVEEMMVAASCSKNFGLYRERVGCAIVVGKNRNKAEVVAGNIMNIARGNYSMPPDHGAEIVNLILNDDELRTSWQQELEAMRVRMLANREVFSANMRDKIGDDRFDFFANHRGMFSLLGLDDDQVTALREKHAIYLVGGGGRVNVAGMALTQIPQFADAIKSVVNI